MSLLKKTPKILINFLIKKCHTKTHLSIMHFLDKMAHLFFLIMEALRSESVKYFIIEIKILLLIMKVVTLNI